MQDRSSTHEGQSGAVGRRGGLGVLERQPSSRGEGTDAGGVKRDPDAYYFFLKEVYDEPTRSPVGFMEAQVNVGVLRVPNVINTK